MVRWVSDPDARKGAWYPALAAVVVLAGCGTGHNAQTRAAQTRMLRSSAICAAAGSQLLTIARHETFGSPVYPRRLFAQGSQESASALNLAIRELRRLKERPSRLLREVQAIANGFAQLASATRKPGRSGEEVSRSDYTRYDALSGRAVRACR